MVKGTEAKNSITEKILNTFEGSFINGKEIRIPYIENNELLQIKLTLTCAKDIINGESGTTSPVSTVTDNEIYPTEEEKSKIAALIDRMNQMGHVNYEATQQLHDNYETLF